MQSGKQEQGGLYTTFANLEMNELQERIKALQEENKEVYDKFQEYELKYGQLQRTFQQQTEDSEQMALKFKEQSDRLKSLEIDIDDLSNIKSVLENKYKNACENIALLESEKTELINKIGRNDNEIKLLKTQVQNLKRAQQEYEEKKLQELELLNKEQEQTKLKERETFNKLIFMEREGDNLKEENRKLKKDIEQTKIDCDQMIKMLENYENKNQLFVKKEESMMKLAKEQKEKVQEAIIDRDKAALKEQQLQKQLDLIQLKNKEEINQLKDQYQKIIENIKSKDQTLMGQKDMKIAELSEQMTQFSVDNEKMGKDLQSLKSENQRLEGILKDNISGSYDDKIQEYERRINELEEKLQLTQKFQEDKIHSMTLEKQQSDSQLKNLQGQYQDLRNQFDAHKQQTSQISGEAQQLKSKINLAQREKQTILEENQKIKKHYE